MMYKKIIICLVAFILMFIGCISKAPATASKETTVQKEIEKPLKEDLKKVELGIHETTIPQDLKSNQNRNPISSLPKYDPDAIAGWQLDLRSRDISKLDLTGRTYDLLHSIFNTETVWPESLPKGFDPDKIIELNKTPGLNIKSLHEKGITGKGIGLAIIDFPLVLDHVEYKDKIKFYEHINYPDKMAHFHGPMVTSISIGDNVGVAPGANLYFIATLSADVLNGRQVYNYNYTAQSISLIPSMNRSLRRQAIKKSC